MRSDGFTLVEVTLSMALVASFSLSVGLVLVPLGTQSRLSKDVAVANAEALRVLERAQSTPISALDTDFPHGSEIPIYDLPAGRVEVSWLASSEDMAEIRFDLVWTNSDVGEVRRVFHLVRAD